MDKKSYPDEVPVRLCNYTDVYYKDVITSDLTFMEATASREQVSRFTVRAGDVAITKDSETPDDIGRPSYVPEDLPGVVYGYHLAIYQPFDPNYSKFIRYLFDSSYIRAELQTRTPGVTRVGLSQDTLRNLRVPTPPPYIAAGIADYLDHETAEIDALIKQLAEVKTLISDRRRTIIDNSFAHAACPEVPLKYLGVLHSGLTLGKRYEVATQKYAYLRVANVQAGYVDLSEVAEIDVPPAVASENRLEPNDVLLTEGGDRDKLGRGALWKGQIDPVLHQNHVFAFRCNSKLLPEYLVYALESTSARIYFDQTARQSTNLASTNSTVVRNFKFPAPPTVDQHSIVERLDHEMLEMQEMLANSNRVIDLARERRAALITAAVTGQIDVTAKNKPAAEQLEDDVAQGLHREYA